MVKERFKIRVVKHLINAMASKSMQQQSEVDAYEPDSRGLQPLRRKAQLVRFNGIMIGPK